MVSVFTRLAIWAVVSSVALVTFASAHEVRPAVADVTVTQGELHVDIELTLETLLAGIDASAFQDTNDAPQAEEYDRLRALGSAEMEGLLGEAWVDISSYFVVQGEGVSGEWDLESVTVPEPGDVNLPRDTKLVMTMSLGAGEGVSLGARTDFGPLILRHVSAGENAFSGYLSPGELSPPLPRTGGAAETGTETFVRYVILGVEHIVPKGLDHILFVLGLFFFSLSLRPLIAQITAFTLAHTVTLALASLQIVTVPASVVEPLIAASIVYIAVENVRGTGIINRWRIAVVFAFGLLHGLGFASVLAEIGLGQGRFLTSLIGFNIGVELGQLFVIAVAFCLVGYWFGKRPYYKAWISNPISIIIGLIGTWWVIERVFL